LLTSAAGTLVIAAWWAVRPLPRAQPEVLDAAADSAPVPPATTVDIAAFRLPIWSVPVAEAQAGPPPPPPPPPSPAPTPFKLQLLAIVREGQGTYRALFYDPDTDRLISAVEGQELAARTLERVEAGWLRLREPIGGSSQDVALRSDSPEEHR
jgi:hypothetical protein